MVEKYHVIGRLSKTFGYDGSLKLKVENHLAHLLDSEKVFFIKIGSNHVPFFVESLKDKTQLIIKFENIDSKETAVKLCNKDLCVPSEKIKTEERVAPSTLLFAWAKGFLIIDPEENIIGEILDIKEFPQQEMAVLIHEEKEILLPIHQDLILGLDEDEQVMMMKIADGLLDL